jgi:hypothetical protein
VQGTKIRASIVAAIFAGTIPWTAGRAQSQALSIDLRNVRQHNVVVTSATHKGQRAVRVVVDTTRIRGDAQANLETLAIIPGIEFSNGVIEAEISGTPGPGAAAGARGFVGIAFRVQDTIRYDAFYVRPTNGRVADQERRNRSAQYISHPDWPWFRLREQTPGKYESYVDLVPDEWTKVRIEVQGTRALLFVHGASQPTLVVNDVKSGANAKGGIALWIGPGTIAHFRDLRVTPAP